MMVTTNPNPSPIQFLILHCSQTPTSQDLSAEDLARQHRSQGCLSIKYHFVIRRNGSVETGRALNQIGLHANKQYNKCSIGICLVGGKGANGRPEANYTEAQYEALCRTLRGLMDTFPESRVVGWNELSQSPADTCPNFNVQEWLDDTAF